MPYRNEPVHVGAHLLARSHAAERGIRGPRLGRLPHLRGPGLPRGRHARRQGAALQAGRLRVPQRTRDSQVPVRGKYTQSNNNFETGTAGPFLFVSHPKRGVFSSPDKIVIHYFSEPVKKRRQKIDSILSVPIR